MNKTCALLVLNYNGAELLKKCLPSLIDDANIPNTGNEIVIIDNKSTDDSKKIVLNEFPEVKWFEATKNRINLSYNEYLEVCKHPYVFILNNDIILHKGCINTLLCEFDDPSVFSVAPLVLNPGNIPENGRKKLYWSLDRLSYKVLDYNKGLTAFVSIAAGMYDREKFVSMDGFDDLLFPAYGEEIDLTIRGYRRGWVALFEPGAVVDHIDGGTIKKNLIAPERRASLVKNRHLIVIKHIHNKFRLSEYLFLTLLAIPIRLISFDKGYLLGTIGAIKQFKQASLKRKIEKQSAKITDDMLFKKLSSL